MDLVVDASVVVKWFLREPARGPALEIRDDFLAGDVVLHAPAVLPFEVLNALRFSGRFTEERCLQAQVVMDGYGIRSHPLAGEVGRRTVHLAFSKDLAVYDAAYIALAGELACKMVSADEGQLAAAADRGLRLDRYSSPVRP